VIYVIFVERLGVHKVGFTGNSIAGRMQLLASSLRSALTLVALFEGTQADERTLHRRLSPMRAPVSGPGRTEMYVGDGFASWLASIPEAARRCGRYARGSRAPALSLRPHPRRTEAA